MAASVADAVNPNGIKTILDNSLSTFPTKGNAVFNSAAKVYSKTLLIVLFYAIELYVHSSTISKSFTKL